MALHRYMTLITVYENPGCTTADVAGALDLPYDAARRRLSRAEAGGLLVRPNGPDSWNLTVIGFQRLQYLAPRAEAEAEAEPASQ